MSDVIGAEAAPRAKGFAFLAWEGGQQVPTEAGRILAAWHADLLGDKGARGALRRARTVDEALITLPMARLRRDLQVGPGLLADALGRIAIAVAIIAEDRPDADLGTTFAKPGGGAKPVSEQRVRLLLNTQDVDSFLRQLRSNLAIVKNRAPVVAVAELVRLWHWPDRRARVRKDLLSAYLEASLPAA